MVILCVSVCVSVYVCLVFSLLVCVKKKKKRVNSSLSLSVCYDVFIVSRKKTMAVQNGKLRVVRTEEQTF